MNQAWSVLEPSLTHYSYSFNGGGALRYVVLYYIGTFLVVQTLIANFSLRFHLAQKLAQRDPFWGLSERSRDGDQ
jgi:hypothetical protein